ncbi:CoA transferase [Sphingomonas sp. CGMCC 1.13654]|uniref:CoA transferase n=1 Tax=Sphingomonas chungangi TaxID=2683589 RepID=A0A838L525_9SPHN|nr:CoA transferase [Sphingomonas chungangi]MBA2933795.1 CoA transferase [Sphingomonas chungangi]MVW55125.1 CoA transferase [Sphingomonas chungangi]
MPTRIDRPLAGIRVVDCVSGPLAPITRTLAELGARVDRLVDETSLDPIDDIVANTGKIRHATPCDRATLDGLIADAHIVVDDNGRDPAPFLDGNPALVWMSVSPFGAGNPYSGWQATDPVFHALSSELARSGIRGHAPLLPPGELAFQCAGTQGAYLLVAALYRALRTGEGEHLDFSALDGAVQALDPGFGISGSATMGRPARALNRDRPVKGIQYPILPCADGHVRICLLAPRQWRGMFRWMGEPEAFAAPEFDQIVTRYKSHGLLPAITAHFAGKTREMLEREGQAHGVPIAGLLSLGEFMASDHARARRALTEVPGPDGAPVTVPNGMLVVNGQRMGVPGDISDEDATVRAGAEAIDRPFDGLRVLDLGVIVVGAEAGRLFADGGADVVKVESRAFPDGNRQSYLPYSLSVSFAAGHRNKRSLGIDLRSEGGRAVFLKLAATADVILSNFKPGTLESLGIGHEVIARTNPGIVMVDSSAFGADGPWSKRLGYGPLVRASTGLTELWRYPDDPESFSDSVTIYPDHVAGRVSAIGAVALLIRRLRTGVGGTASVAQAEVMLAHAGAAAARVSRGEPLAKPRDVPWGVFAAAGEDDFAVITVRGQADWKALCGAIGHDEWLTDPEFATAEGRRAHRMRIDEGVAAWCAPRAPAEIAETLQAAGVPSAPMLRVGDLLDFGYFTERGLFRCESHPFLDEEVVSERHQYRSTRHTEPAQRPAPLAGEQSIEIVREWIGMDEADAAALAESGVLEPTQPAVYALIEKTRAKAAVA